SCTICATSCLSCCGVRSNSGITLQSAKDLPQRIRKDSSEQLPRQRRPIAGTLLHMVEGIVAGGGQTDLQLNGSRMEPGSKRVQVCESKVSNSMDAKDSGTHKWRQVHSASDASGRTASLQM